MQKRNFHDFDGPRALDIEFARTRLPKSALAKYLGMGNSAVTKMITGARFMRPHEKSAAAAFFSIVTKNASQPFLRGVGKLRSKQSRDRAGRSLADWASDRAPMPIAKLLSAAMRGEILAADQIVALAACEDLDLFALVVTGKVRRADGAAPHSSEPPFAGFNDAVRRWAEEAGAPESYRLNPHVEPIAVVSSTMAAGEAPQAERGIELHPADCQLPVTADLESYLIAGDLLAPRFEQGDVIFMEREDGPVRNGDLVAVVLGKDQDGILQAIVGRLLLNSRNMVSVNQTMGRRRDILKREVQAVRRIVFCSF